MTSEQPDRADERRLAAHMRAVAAITPAVAHDLRAPINSMVFNLEILKETITGGLASDPKARERQARYVRVLREELSRLHRGIEIWLAQTAERSPEPESAGPARAGRRARRPARGAGAQAPGAGRLRAARTSRRRSWASGTCSSRRSSSSAWPRSKGLPAARTLALAPRQRRRAALPDDRRRAGRGRRRPGSSRRPGRPRTPPRWRSPKRCSRRAAASCGAHGPAGPADRLRATMAGSQPLGSSWAPGSPPSNATRTRRRRRPELPLGARRADRGAGVHHQHRHATCATRARRSATARPTWRWSTSTCRTAAASSCSRTSSRRPADRGRADDRPRRRRERRPGAAAGRQRLPHQAARHRPPEERSSPTWRASSRRRRRPPRPRRSRRSASRTASGCCSAPRRRCRRSTR